MPTTPQWHPTGTVDRLESRSWVTPSLPVMGLMYWQFLQSGMSFGRSVRGRSESRCASAPSSTHGTVWTVPYGNVTVLTTGVLGAEAMRILLAGGGGFIGSHLADRLVARGDEVVVVDSFVTGRRSNVRHLEDSPGFQLVEHDIVDGLPAMGAFDVVANLASPASPDDFASLSIEILEAGSSGNGNLLNYAADCGARFLLASTSEVYGDALVHPQREDYHGNVDPTGPRGCYDEAKRFAEAMTAAYSRRKGVDARIARIFNTYGERMVPSDGRVVNSFVAQALRGDPLKVFGDGRQTRSFCHVSDQVAGLIALLESDYDKPVNIGNPEEVTIADLARVVIEATGSKSSVEHVDLPEKRAGDPERRCPDIGLAGSVLGWEPQISLREGVAAMITYFRNHENF